MTVIKLALGLFVFVRLISTADSLRDWAYYNSCHCITCTCYSAIVDVSRFSNEIDAILE